MQKARSHTSVRRGKAAQMKATIIDLLQWDDQQYADFQYESGLAYLRFYIPWDKWGQDMLQRSKLFWNWWKNQWTLRDEAFVMEHQEAFDKVRMETRRTLYRYVHDAAALASEIYPNRTVLDESYNQMIHAIHQEELHG